MSTLKKTEDLLNIASRFLIEKKCKIKDIYNQIMQGNPNNIAFIYRIAGVDNYITYKEYNKLCFEYASKLSYLLKDIKKHSIIALKLSNSPYFPICLWATLIAGYKPLLIDFKLDIKSSNILLENGLAKAILVEKDEFKVKSINVHFLGEINGTINDDDFEDEIIFCSSGTTGVSKQLIYNGFNLVNQLNASKLMLNETKDIIYYNKKSNIRNLALIPFHHIFAFVAILLWYSFYNSTLVFISSLDPKKMIKDIKELKITHLYHVPLFFEVVKNGIYNTSKRKGNLNLITSLIDKNLNDKTNLKDKLMLKKIRNKIFGNSIRFLISGGGNLSNDIARFYNGLGYKIHNGFGMSEVGVTSVELSDDINDLSKNSIGKPLYGVSYKINDKNELLIKSNINHVKEIINKKIVDSYYEDGYFNSCDIVSVDNENRYYFKGRSKDIIILNNGENIFPIEIEENFKSIEGINNLCAFDSNNEIILIVSSTKDIYNELNVINNKLPFNKKVNKIILTKENLPLSSSLKVKRYLVKENFLNGLYKVNSETKSTSLNNYDLDKSKEVINKLNDIFKDVLDLNEFIDGNAHLINDLHIDSMTYVSLVNKIEETFNIVISNKDYGNLFTLNEFAKAILDLIN